MDFHKTFITGILDETINMRSYNPTLASKLHILLNILAPC